jgi:hypothetical protein
MEDHEPQPDWSTLPPEIWNSIFGHLPSPKDWASASRSAAWLHPLAAKFGPPRLYAIQIITNMQFSKHPTVKLVFNDEAYEQTYSMHRAIRVLTHWWRNSPNLTELEICHQDADDENIPGITIGREGTVNVEEHRSTTFMVFSETVMKLNRECPKNIRRFSYRPMYAPTIYTDADRGITTNFFGLIEKWETTLKNLTICYQGRYMSELAAAMERLDLNALHFRSVPFSNRHEAANPVTRNLQFTDIITALHDSCQNLTQLSIYAHGSTLNTDTEEITQFVDLLRALPPQPEFKLQSPSSPHWIELAIEALSTYEVMSAWQTNLCSLDLGDSIQKFAITPRFHEVFPNLTRLVGVRFDTDLLLATQTLVPFAEKHANDQRKLKLHICCHPTHQRDVRFRDALVKLTTLPIPPTERQTRCQANNRIASITYKGTDPMVAQILVQYAKTNIVHTMLFTVPLYTIDRLHAVRHSALGYTYA